MAPSTVGLVCSNSTCGSTFVRKASEARVSERRGRAPYCSRKCLGEANSRAKRIHSGISSGTCVFCEKPFSRPHHGTREKGKYCTVRCSALAHSAARRVSPPNSTCPTCGGKMHPQAERCHQCRMGEYRLRTLGELRAALSVSQYHAKIRGMARYAYEGPMSCAACGYDLHVDIGHIRPVKSFPPEATLTEVNHPDNLVALDKRCHWEFDHGHLAYMDGRMISATPK